MQIRRVKLQNFQKHSALEVFFSEGVNIIHGPTGTGKSCLMRAIAWNLMNIGKTVDIRKEKTKETFVEIEFDIDLTIKRIISDSINRYIVNYNGDKKQYDSFGRTMPEEIQQILGIDEFKVGDVTLIPNIADQISMPFLVNESDITKAKIFNTLTGTDISDKIVSDINKETLQAQRKIKLLKEQNKEKENNIIELQKKADQLKGKKEKVEIKYNLLNDNYEQYNSLKNYLKKLEILNQNECECSYQIHNIKIVENNIFEKTIKKINIYLDLKKLWAKIKQIEKNIINNKERLKGIRIIDIKNLSNLVKQFEELFKRQGRLKEIEKEIEEKEEERKENRERREKYIKKYKEYLKESKVCPTCYSQITEQVLKNIKL